MQLAVEQHAAAAVYAKPLTSSSVVESRHSRISSTSRRPTKPSTRPKDAEPPDRAVADAVFAAQTDGQIAQRFMQARGFVHAEKSQAQAARNQMR